MWMFSLPSKHYRGTNCLHSLTLTAAQIYQIFKYLKGGLSLSSRNKVNEIVSFKYLSLQVNVSEELTSVKYVR